MARELVGLVVIFLAAFTLLALFTYSPNDPSLNRAVSSRTIQNRLGVVGAYWGGFLAEAFGVWAYVLIGWCIWRALRLLMSLRGLPLPRALGAGFLAVVLLAFLGSPWGIFGLSVGKVHGGGGVGEAVFHGLSHYLSSFGAYFLLSFCLIAAVQLTFGLTWENFWSPVLRVLGSVFLTAAGAIQAAWARWQERRAHRPQAEKKPRKATSRAEPADQAPDLPPILDVSEPLSSAGKKFEKTRREKETASSAPAETSASSPSPAAKAKRPAVSAALSDLPLPPLDLLTLPPVQKGPPVDEAVCQQQAESLITCLNDFGIQGEVQRVVPGPVVTMFEFKPAPGVKISRIVGLSVDMALAMKALAVRIEGPIPGKDTVGVEIPNAKRQTVYLRDIIDTDIFRNSSSKLTLGIGKDIHGRPQVADLAKMPHLLVAGATGSGKSVCINAILLSILYKATPDEVKLLLVDPKRIELSVYNDLPHLVHPVVTETTVAKSALDWAVSEMDRRYEAMAVLGVRNIAGYNEKLAKLGDNRPEDMAELTHMPYLVIIIDELADLMMTAAKDVEVSIVRLAQLARAAGIHLVLATQRPSVDVVTGLIKANFPTRIAFQVTSKHDSRTILDAVGAEYLLGRGDMLYKPNGGKTTRMHGAFVSDEETAAVVDFWKSKAAPDFALDFTEWQGNADNGSNGGDMGGDGGDTASDSVYPQAVDFVMEQGKASISLIQRRFRIGFNRAARFIEQMERDGLLGPQEGSKPRAVLKGKD